MYDELMKEYYKKYRQKTTKKNKKKKKNRNVVIEIYPASVKFEIVAIMS